MPAHHPAISDLDDDDEVQVTAKKVPKPKEEMSPMPKGMSEAERPMPLTHQFHVTSIARMPKAKGGSQARPGKSPIARLKEQQQSEANAVS